MANNLFQAIPFATVLALPLLALPETKANGPVLVVARPGSDTIQTFDLIDRANGRLLRSTAIPWVAVAISDGPDFPMRLRQAGAWAAIGAAQFAGCLTTDEPSDRTMSKDTPR